MSCVMLGKIGRLTDTGAQQGPFRPSGPHCALADGELSARAASENAALNHAFVSVNMGCLFLGSGCSSRLDRAAAESHVAVRDLLRCTDPPRRTVAVRTPKWRRRT